MIFIKNKSGFTLVELLIAMAISGIIMMGVYSAFRTQQDSYLAQEQVAEMQQNIRAGLYLMIKELRMAGYDDNNGTSHASCSLGAAGVSVAPGILAVTPNQLDFSMDLNADGDCADTDENITYSIYNHATTGFPMLGRNDNSGGAGRQAVAENIQAIEFSYWDSSSPPLAAATATDVVAVDISILARARQPDRNYTDNRAYPATPAGTVWVGGGDNRRRRFQTVRVQCRNMGL